MTRAEFCTAVGLHPAKLDAWLSERPGYREPPDDLVQRSRNVLRRHVASCTALLDGKPSRDEMQPSPTPQYRNGSLLSSREVAWIVSLLPFPRGVCAEKLGVSRRRLDGWCAGEVRREPPPAVLEKARALFKTHLEAVRAAELPILGAPWDR